MLWVCAFYGYVAACCIHLPFLKTATKLTALNNPTTCPDFFREPTPSSLKLLQKAHTLETMLEVFWELLLLMVSESGFT